MTNKRWPQVVYMILNHFPGAKVVAVRETKTKDVGADATRQVSLFKENEIEIRPKRKRGKNASQDDEEARRKR